jgi:hypothetical protein
MIPMAAPSAKSTEESGGMVKEFALALVMRFQRPASSKVAV